MSKEGDSVIVGQVLRTTGYPFVDVGAATIAAFHRKPELQDVTLGDLDTVAEFIAERYVNKPLKSFLSSIFPNSGYVNPTMGAVKREEEIRRTLYGYREDPLADSPKCTFCGRPAGATVFRQHIPLTAGGGQMNFGPGGRAGSPVCGICLLCVQAMPLGCAMRCNGRLLLVEAGDQRATYDFALEFLSQNRQILNLVDGSGEEKIRYPQTFLIETLTKLSKQQPWATAGSGSITAYHFTNYGSNPDVAIIHLPSELVRFLVLARSELYRRAWDLVVSRAWERDRRTEATSKKGGSKATDAAQTTANQQEHDVPGARRNWLYEDLCRSPFPATMFIRRYFLRLRTVNPRAVEEKDSTLTLVPWNLVALFLREVLRMDRYRIERIKVVGERIASLVVETYDTKLLRNLYGSRKGNAGYAILRTALIRASKKEVEATRGPIISFDDFITIFEEGDDSPYRDWALAADLLYIRVLDNLHEREWFTKHPEAVQAILETSDEAEEDKKEEVLAG